MERADEALRPAIAVTAGLGQLDAAVTAGIVVCLHARLGAHDNHRLAEVAVLAPVAHLRDLLQPARHLPDVRPHVLVLEAIEFLVIIALGGNPLGVLDAKRYRPLAGFRNLEHVHSLQLPQRTPYPGQPTLTSVPF